MMLLVLRSPGAGQTSSSRSAAPEIDKRDPSEPVFLVTAQIPQKDLHATRQVRANVSQGRFRKAVKFGNQEPLQSRLAAPLKRVEFSYRPAPPKLRLQPGSSARRCSRKRRSGSCR